MRFRYQALTISGETVEATLDADTKAEAADLLRRDGKTLLRLNVDNSPVSEKRIARSHQRLKPRELLLLTKQMKMLLESGSALVPALEAVERQSERAEMKTLIQGLRSRVEGGGTLKDGLGAYPQTFSVVYCAMVGAGEATATLPVAFDRLSDLTSRQLTVRKALLGALAYPAFLSVLCVSVMVVLLAFVVPRFRMLFENLNRPVPYSTQLMFEVSQALLTYWPAILAAGLAAVAGVVLALRSASVRERIQATLFDLPIIGRVMARFEFMGVLRVWSAMLRSNVGLLETIAQSKHASSNQVFRRVLDELEECVQAGGHIGASLSQSKHIDPIIASAVSTGEENGRLPDAVEFVSEWLEEDNMQTLSTLTRIAEPALISVMGLGVGCVSATLFMPLFDMATM